MLGMKFFSVDILANPEGVCDLYNIFLFRIYKKQFSFLSAVV